MAGQLLKSGVSAQNRIPPPTRSFDPSRFFITNFPYARHRHPHAANATIDSLIGAASAPAETAGVAMLPQNHLSVL